MQATYKYFEIINAAEYKLLLCLVELDAIFNTDLLEKIKPIEKLLIRLCNAKYNVSNYYRIINDPYRQPNNPMLYL